MGPISDFLLEVSRKLRLMVFAFVAVFAAKTAVIALDLDHWVASNPRSEPALSSVVIMRHGEDGARQVP